jgi:arylformamidase
MMMTTMAAAYHQRLGCLWPASHSSVTVAAKELLMASSWIDVSVTLRDGMVHWPDNPPVRITRLKDMERGDHCTFSMLSLGSHTGTHMDAPVHFVRGGRGLDEMPLEVTVGPARVIAVDDPESIKPRHLVDHRLRPGDRVLFKTRNSQRNWASQAFLEDFVYLATDAARVLVDAGVQLIGVDYLSVGGYEKNGLAVHQVLLQAGIWIIEGLDLAAVNEGAVELICLPLKIHASDGAPCRALVRPILDGAEAVDTVDAVDAVDG